jgi:hypothetical protein
VSATPARPPDLDRYLLARERLVADVRWHPVAVLAPTLWLLGLLTLFGWVAAGLPDNSTLGPVLPFLLLALVGWYAFRIASWRRERLVVTDRRLLLVSGLISRRLAVMPLRKVTDMTYEQPLASRMFDDYGWGTFIFESAGQDQAFHRIRFLPRPDELYRLLTEEIFGEHGIYGRKPLPTPAAAPQAEEPPAMDRRDDED